MKIAELQERLMAVARANPPSDAVPYAFEQRIMAHLSERPAAVADTWAFWSRALWRAAAPCLGVMVLFCAWSYQEHSRAPVASVKSMDFTRELESSLLASFDRYNKSW